MFDLSSKIAVVTGGGSGIGRAICQKLAEQGATVHVLDWNAEAANDTVSLIAKSGHPTAFAHKIDVSHQMQMVETAQIIATQHSRIDIWINNAGISHIGNVENTSEADFNRVFEVNVKGTYNGIFAAIPHLKARGGVILNMCSIVGSVGIPDRFAYSMSKGAVLTMTLSTAKDYVKYNIRCNCLSPARVHTPFVDGYLAQHYPDNQEEMFAKLAATQPIGRMAKPEEVAYLATFLCSDEASFITGCDYPIDGGFIRINN